MSEFWNKFEKLNFFKILLVKIDCTVRLCGTIFKGTPLREKNLKKNFFNIFYLKKYATIVVNRKQLASSNHCFLTEMTL